MAIAHMLADGNRTMFKILRNSRDTIDITRSRQQCTQYAHLLVTLCSEVDLVTHREGSIAGYFWQKSHSMSPSCDGCMSNSSFTHVKVS